MVKIHETARELRPNALNASAEAFSHTPAPRLTSKRKNTSTACGSCRAKRIKCVGEKSPCVNCAQLDIECLIDTGADQRRKAVTKAKLQELEQDQEILGKLVTALHGLNDVHVERTLANIVSDAAQRADGEVKHGALASDLNSRDNSGATPQPGISSPDPMSNQPIPYEHVQDRKSNPFVSTERAQPQEKVSNLQWSFNDPKSTSRPSSCAERNAGEEGTKEAIANVGSEYLAPGAVRSFGNLAMSDAIRANQYPQDVQRRQSEVINGHIEMCLPLHTPCQVDEVAHTVVNTVLSFQELARNLLAEGAAARSVLSMDAFSLDLFFRERTPDDEHTVANWACEFGKTWIGFPTEVRLAAVHYIGSLMRWLIMPCTETYQMMSPPVRPLPSQLMIPHTLDIDLLGAPPVVREMQLLNGQGGLEYVDVETQRLHWEEGPQSCTENVNVPCSASCPDAIADGQGRHYRPSQRFTKKFVAFLDVADNWSIHRDMLQKLPGLHGHVRVHDECQTMCQSQHQFW